MKTFSDGRVLMLWSSEDGIIGQFFTNEGSADGGQILVSSTSGHPSAGELSDGRFVVTWSRPYNGQPVRGQLFLANGTKDGLEFIVDVFEGHVLNEPVVGAFSTGGFVVVYRRPKHVGSGIWVEHIYAQKLTAWADLDGDRIQVNQVQGNSHFGPSVLTNVPQGFRAIWRQTADGNDNIVSRLIDPASSTVILNEYSTGAQYESRTAAFDDGSYIVVWVSDDPAGGERKIMVQRFSADGSKLYL